MLVAQKLNTLPKFAKLRQVLGADVMSAKFSTQAGALGTFVRRGEDLLTTSMCFVAGTLVHTSTGLVPIEQLAVGDQVLARDERTGEQGYKSVIDTIVTHPQQILTMEFQPDNAQADGGDVECVSGTGEHPLWVESVGQFVPMGRLRVGDRLSLSTGDAAEMVRYLKIVGLKWSPRDRRLRWALRWIASTNTGNSVWMNPSSRCGAGGPAAASDQAGVGA